MNSYYGRHQSHHVKLKDSCDPCSASKVRCTKEKPSCARCSKLGHDCYYSPARRIGRPNRTFSAHLESPSPTTRRPSPKHQRRASQLSCPDFDPFSAVRGTTASSPPASTTVFQPTQAIDEARNSCSSNCFELMLGLLSRLTTLKTPKMPAELNAALSSAVKVLSRVLICPCSQSLDVALLTAAGCNCVLDLVDALIRLPWNTLSPTYTGNSSCNHTMGELRRVANLTVQFTSRYYGIIDRDQRETLLCLAADLKSRLQSTIEDVTGEMEMAALFKGQHR